MTTNAIEEKKILRDLGDGLILRRSTPADADALSLFNSQVHSENGPEQPDLRIGAWTRDLLETEHPTFAPDDFTIVEDTRTGKIVSSINLISQTWSYEGIPFKVGRPELVATLPEYRNRGLVRAQFEVVHQWSEARGEILQAITGIPYYYRQFGYEMTLDLAGGRIGYRSLIPKLKDGEKEPYRLRAAVEEDISFISEVYQQGSRRYPIRCEWDRAAWLYELQGKSEQNVNRFELRVIESTREGYIGERVGFIAHPPFSWGPTMVANFYELKPGVSWGAVTPSVIRYLFNTGEALAKAEGKESEFHNYGFWLGEEHPVYHVIPDLLPRIRRPYSWYIRIPDIPRFIQHIAPALEKRLANSELAGHTGEIKITFYRSGLRMAFKEGQLEAVESYRPEPVGHAGDAAFPDLTFLQLITGYRSLDELEYAFTDVWWQSDKEYSLLNALFPRQPSDIWPIS